MNVLPATTTLIRSSPSPPDTVESGAATLMVSLPVPPSTRASLKRKGELRVSASPVGLSKSNVSSPAPPLIEIAVPSEGRRSPSISTNRSSLPVPVADWFESSSNVSPISSETIGSGLAGSSSGSVVSSSTVSSAGSGIGSARGATGSGSMPSSCGASDGSGSVSSEVFSNPKTTPSIKADISAITQIPKLPRTFKR